MITEEQKTKITTLARAIVRNPERDPRHLIVSTCNTEEEHRFLEAECERAEKDQLEAGAKGRGT